MKRNKMLLLIVIIELIIILIIPLYLNYKYPSILQNHKPSVLVIDIFGQIIKDSPSNIVESEEFPTPILSKDIINILRFYENNDDIKAFIFDIDSNGGNALTVDFASQISTFKKPIVAVIRDQALSGGYYVAAASDRIFANEISNIGDIGVTTITEYRRGNQSWKKCHISSSVYKIMYSNDCPGIDIIYYENEKIRAKELNQEFAFDIAKFRNLSIPYILKLADGTIYKGNEAVELGLIDEIGGIHEARDWLEKELNMNLEIIYYREIKNNAST